MLCHHFCVRGTRTQPLISVDFSVHYWVSCVINRGGFFEMCRHTFASLWRACLRFASHWRANSRGDSCFLGVHLSNVFWGLLFCHLLKVCWIFLKGTYLKSLLKVCYRCVFAGSKRSSSKSVLNLRKAYIFKSLLKVFYRSVFNESSKAFIFQNVCWKFTPWVEFYFGLSLYIFLWKMRATRLVHASNLVIYLGGRSATKYIYLRVVKLGVHCATKQIYWVV